METWEAVETCEGLALAGFEPRDQIQIEDLPSLFPSPVLAPFQFTPSLLTEFTYLAAF